MNSGRDFGSQQQFRDISTTEISNLAVELSSRFEQMKQDDSIDKSKAMEIFKEVIQEFHKGGDNMEKTVSQTIQMQNQQITEQNGTDFKFQHLDKMLNQWENEMDLEFTPCVLMGYMDKRIAEGVM